MNLPNLDIRSPKFLIAIGLLLLFTSAYFGFRYYRSNLSEEEEIGKGQFKIKLHRKSDWFTSAIVLSGTGVYTIEVLNNTGPVIGQMCGPLFEVKDREEGFFKYDPPCRPKFKPSIASDSEYIILVVGARQSQQNHQ